MIVVDEMVVEFDGDRILDDVSVAVDGGEVLGIIGPNGAGKTTLLRAIDGIVNPCDGSIRVCDDPISSLTARETARRIAVLPQSTDVPFDFSVRDIVAMGRTPYGGRFGRQHEHTTNQIDRALERTETTSIANRPITEISGGERQRVLIARAIAQDTPVLLLDEPTANLDINHQIATFELVRSLAADGKAVLTAIHDLNLAARFCDRLLLLADGKPIATGTPEEVLAAERIESTYGVRTAVRRDPIHDAVRVSPLPERTPPSGVRIHVVGHGGAAGPLCRGLVDAGYEVSVGIVRQGGPDEDVARALDLSTIAFPPAAPVTDYMIDRHRRAVDNATITIVSPFHVGPTTRHLLQVAQTATRVIVVDDPPFVERNHDGPVSRRLWEDLTTRHPVVAPAEVPRIVAELLAEAHPNVGESSEAILANGGESEREV